MSELTLMRINTKAKGTAAERELVHLFWANGWAALRSAGSGAIRYPVPDIVAANNIRKVAIECKTVKDAVYIDKKEIDDLKIFSNAFGAEGWVGLRFGQESGQGKWFFLGVEELKATKTGFTANLALCQMKGLLFEQLIKNH